MLSFTSEQLESLHVTRERRLQQVMFEESRGPFAERTQPLSDRQLREAIHQTIAKAESCGVISDAGIRVFFRIAFCWGLTFKENTAIPWVYPIEPWEGEPPEEWICRVHDIALATARKERRWAWIKTTSS
jgi:hypothetical protein